MRPSVGAVMERRVCSVGMDDTVQQVQTLFAQRQLSWAPVHDADGQVVGVIGEADLSRLRALVADPATTPAWQLCTYQPAAVTSDTPVDDAAALMLARHIHHLVVMEQGETVGVVSSLDLLRALIIQARPG